MIDVVGKGSIYVRSRPAKDDFAGTPPLPLAGTTVADDLRSSDTAPDSVSTGQGKLFSHYLAHLHTILR